MNRILDPPAERDLPPQRAARMRAELVRTIRQPRTRPVRLRVAVAAAAASVVAGGLVLVTAAPGEETRVLAMGPAELSPPQRQVAERCLRENSGPWPSDRVRAPDQVPVSMADLAVAANQGDRAVVLFLTEVGNVACDADLAGEDYFSFGAEKWRHPEWLPGPVQRLLLSSSRRDGGDVVVSGRVSPRVHRLVLEHGNGHTTTARLAGGAFGLLTDGPDVQPEAELVSYEEGGRELDRQRLFTPFDRLDRCYTDPSGEVIYGRPGPDCRPAERWAR